jgi:Tfp pilus assembly protein PilO
MRLINRIRNELGVLGMAALALLALAAVFTTLVLKPLQQKSESLAAAAAKQARSSAFQASGSAGDKLGAIYKHLEKPEEPTDWLAKLHAIGKATGVELKSANYRTQAGGGKLERYEIVLPAAGSYGQIRDFLKRALGEIPVLSLDQITLKRDNRNDAAVQAELRLTLHLVKP